MVHAFPLRVPQVLCALEDAGVPVDVVGGTSQGAFMAGLHAQGLARDALQVCAWRCVRVRVCVRMRGVGARTGPGA